VQARREQGKRALQRRGSRCVLVLPASSPSLPSPPSPRARQLAEWLRRRDDELTRAPRAQDGPAQRVERRVERCRSWGSTSSGSSRPLYVPLALSARVARLEHALLRSCAPCADLLHRARRSVAPSMAPSSVLVSKARALARRPPLDGAGRCSSCLSRKLSGPGCRKMSVSSSLLVPAAARVEPSRTGPYEAVPALTCP